MGLGLQPFGFSAAPLDTLRSPLSSCLRKASGKHSHLHQSLPGQPSLSSATSTGTVSFQRVVLRELPRLLASEQMSLYRERARSAFWFVSQARARSHRRCFAFSHTPIPCVRKSCLLHVKFSRTPSLSFPVLHCHLADPPPSPAGLPAPSLPGGPLNTAARAPSPEQQGLACLGRLTRRPHRCLAPAAGASCWLPLAREAFPRDPRGRPPAALTCFPRLQAALCRGQDGRLEPHCLGSSPLSATC